MLYLQSLKRRKEQDDNLRMIIFTEKFIKKEEHKLVPSLYLAHCFSHPRASAARLRGYEQ